jgi:hypothetical protein
MRRVAHREDLVSVGIAAFGLVIVSSGAAYVYLSRDYDQLRKSFVLEKSSEVNNPADNWKVVILEDVLGDYAQRHEIRQALYSPSAPGVERLAFDLWADSPLSLLGYSCAIHVVSADDNTVSEFSVDMPYRARLDEGGERTDTPDGNEWAVLDLTRSTPQGEVRFYRGVVNVGERDAFSDAPAARVLGKVIVDVPFFFESLELAARTGPRTPEVLRNVQEGGGPRVEGEALAGAHWARSSYNGSSSEQFAVEAASRRNTGARGRQNGPSCLTRARIACRTGDSRQRRCSRLWLPSPRGIAAWSALSLLVLHAGTGDGRRPAPSRACAKRPTLTRAGARFPQKLLASFSW